MFAVRNENGEKVNQYLWLFANPFINNSPGARIIILVQASIMSLV